MKNKNLTKRKNNLLLIKHIFRILYKLYVAIKCRIDELLLSKAVVGCYYYYYGPLSRGNIKSFIIYSIFFPKCELNFMHTYIFIIADFMGFFEKKNEIMDGGE